MTKKLLSGLLLAVVLTSAFAGSARADDRDWREHEDRAHRYWHRPHPVVVEPVAPVVYAPPVIVASPPPPPMGINLVIPMHFN